MSGHALVARVVTAYLAGVLTPALVWGGALAWLTATESTGWRCRVCGWTTGWCPALPAWVRWRWHRHVVRGLLRRCSQ